VEGVEIKGMGSGWSWQTCQLYTNPVFSLFLWKSYVMFVILHCEFKL